jgi:flavodoxin
MKKTLVVYYSRTGFTRRIATEVATGLGYCDIEELQEYGSRSGAWGFLRSALQSLFNIRAAIKPTRNSPALFDLVIIATPVWVGRMAAPIRTYLDRHQDIKEIGLVCTYGRSGWENVLREIRSTTGRWPVASVALTDDEITARSYSGKLARYLARLSDYTAPRLKAIA